MKDPECLPDMRPLLRRCSPGLCGRIPAFDSVWCMSTVGSMVLGRVGHEVVAFLRILPSAFHFPLHTQVSCARLKNLPGLHRVSVKTPCIVCFRRLFGHTCGVPMSTVYSSSLNLVDRLREP